MWSETKKLLSAKLPKTTFSLWIEPIRCSGEDENAIELTGPDRFFCNWVRENYLPVINECLAAQGKADVAVRFRTGQTEASPAAEAGPKRQREQLPLPEMPRGRSFVRTLHPRYTFDEFVVGESNFLPHSASHAIAKGDYSLGHCLYIEAGTGLGKSHLTHAVAHHVMKSSPGARLHYLTAQQLTAEMVRSIKSDTMDMFKEKYHNCCDVLLMEDVQVFAGKTRTQEELMMALDVLLDRGKRVIFTGSMPPKDIPNIDVALRSRLSAGLITTIKPPDLRTRLMIIRRKAVNTGLALDDGLVEYMAQNIRGDIRRVESAIVGLKAKACMLKKAPDLEMVKEVLAGIVSDSQQISAEVIRDFVAREFRTKVAELRSKSRKKNVAFPRQVGMYLARKFTDQGLADIGSAFDRDHSTVVHSVRVITEAMVRQASVRGQVDHLSDKLKKLYLE